MNDVLDFLGSVRGVAQVYLWSVFAVATVLLIADLAKNRARRVEHEQETRERKAA